LKDILVKQFYLNLDDCNIGICVKSISKPNNFLIYMLEFIRREFKRGDRYGLSEAVWVYFFGFQYRCGCIFTIE